MKERLKKIWLWLRKEIFVKEMILYVIIAELIFWSPVIITAILALIINPWFWTACGTIILFWSGPFTPAIPLQLGLAVGLKKLITKIKACKDKKKDKKKDKEV